MRIAQYNCQKPAAEVRQVDWSNLSAERNMLYIKQLPALLIIIQIVI